MSNEATPAPTLPAGLMVQKFKVGLRVVRYTRQFVPSEEFPHQLSVVAHVNGVKCATTYSFPSEELRDRSFAQASQELAERYINKLQAFTGQWTHK